MDEAERELRQVLATDPEDYRSRNNLAGIYRAQGKLAAAMSEVKRALQTRPTYAAGWHNLGQLCLLAKDRAGAQAALRKAVSLDPSDTRALTILKAIGDGPR